MNCEAEYEIPNEAIPPQGRDVQCSNCGYTWFVPPISEGGRTGSVATANTPPNEKAAPTSQNARTPSKPSMTPATREMLQQEAQREIAARQAEGTAAIETQSELNLDTDPVPRHRPDMYAAPTAVTEPALPAPLKAELPSIKAISESIAARTQPTPRRVRKSAPGHEPRQSRRGRGFRFGFALAIVIWAALALVYLQAPNIIEAFPQLSRSISAYVLWINDLRQTIYTGADTLLTQLRTAALSAQSGV